MSRFPQVKARDLVKVVLLLGFKFRDQSGSHAVYVHSDGRRTTISIHPSQTIGIGLLTKIIKKDLGISKQEFIELLKK
ncbi:hypothetical protein A3A60_03015 [Candidatus Curtissbacteria bacterium RIFCSPLOWO2_01_FULL_42_26]|uniref:Addiction module toxin, HicA family n=1 Tax=Candidatus Curtissbacteria bacterium RIFCSPLOWO2_01_FULL_42_26 TaxID=1797729 RepID=A0A1F5I2J9_9BACT|nr:MAG: hypothetical protein A3A60_03015 [Candidatus Curtissbacteria bacterium RIFCSPLOWO2_01_FULL_42_26]